MYTGPTTVELTDRTEELIERMAALAEKYVRSGDRYRAATFERAKNTFTAANKVGWIFAELEDLVKFNQVGNSIIQEAKLVLESAESERLKVARTKNKLSRTLTRFPSIDKARAEELAAKYATVEEFASSLDATELDLRFASVIEQFPLKLTAAIAGPVAKELRVLVNLELQCTVRGYYIDVLAFTENIRLYNLANLAEALEAADYICLYRGTTDCWYAKKAGEYVIPIMFTLAMSRDRAARILHAKLSAPKWEAARLLALSRGLVLQPTSLRIDGRVVNPDEAEVICAELKTLV